MSIRTQLRNIENDIARLNALKEKLTSSPEMRKELEFEDKLTSLMSEFGMQLKDVIRVIDGPTAKATVAKGQRAPRTVKIYKNPSTGEIVESKGGNNKTLSKWKAEFGAETVLSWLQK